MINSATSPDEGNLSITPEEVRGLARLVEENGLSELLFETGGIKVVLRTAAYQSASTAPMPVGFSPLGAPMATATEEPEEETRPYEEAPLVRDESRLHRVEAPIMGTFYRASGQDTPPFVDVDDVIEEGQVIGLIEAMKVFSEVPSAFAGRVIEIPVKNGTLVQPGETLIVLEKE